MTATTLKQIARWTGVGYLIIFITGFFANFLVIEGMVVDGDAPTTANNIATQLSTFRWGLFAFLIMVIVDVLLAGPLYLLLKPVSEHRSRFSSWLRLVNGTIFGVALFNLFGILNLFSEAGLHGDPSNPEIQQQAASYLLAFDQIWLIGLVFFGLHLLLLGNLIWRSEHFPKWIGALLLFAGVGYLVDSFTHLLLPTYSDYQNFFEMMVIIPGVLGEFSLTLWLLIRGVRQLNSQ